MDGPEPRDHTVDPWEFHGRWPVRLYELDSNGHVNNAVYLNYAEQVALEHIEALGYGREWCLLHGGGWFVREHHATYHRPATFGDILLLTTVPLNLGAVTGKRRTLIHRESDGELLMDATTLWVWVRSDGRPTRIPAELRAIWQTTAPPSA